MSTIRPACVDDAPAIARLVHHAYRKYIARIGKPPGPMLDDYPTLIAAQTVWVCQGGSEIAGAVVLKPTPDHLLLDNIAVAPAWQGRGIGRMLLDFADAEARRSGFTELRLYTHVLMHENQALYANRGWEEYGRGEQDGFHRVFMRKPVVY